MPIGSPGDEPARSLRELGLPARAVTVLTRAGITDVDRLARLSREELAAVPGLGPGTIAAIRRVLPGAPAPDVEEESPDAPAIPSFDSLRAPRGRSAVDLLTAGPTPPPTPPPAAPATGPRPAEYGDLLRLGVRLACWSLRQPGRLLHRLLGDRG
ncbi:conserved protein of unknown function [Modestobacter italicus]|uniref:RNA polymerase alpha subunit C-terminal domain-containing protein n=1 Tax=Modestobacter italicus (strain DSM 44449 / CECT 9708 / BC 501) TaxID=2732864 RepID=I4EWH1_MODI5|nr:DNA-directed RNA polymerase subunit alpha C-terminal domain-containing protein [Modestobacter marinus]CCH87734.1 conserved protein of unknown function [Modestobacter marinus]